MGMKRTVETDWRRTPGLVCLPELRPSLSGSNHARSQPEPLGRGRRKRFEIGDHFGPLCIVLEPGIDHLGARHGLARRLEIGVQRLSSQTRPDSRIAGLNA